MLFLPEGMGREREPKVARRSNNRNWAKNSQRYKYRRE